MKFLHFWKMRFDPYLLFAQKNDEGKTTGNIVNRTKPAGEIIMNCL